MLVVIVKQVFLGPTSQLPNGVPICDVDSSHEAKINKLQFHSNTALLLLEYDLIPARYTMLYYDTHLNT
jgi:hypothetical protein